MAESIPPAAPPSAPAAPPAPAPTPTVAQEVKAEAEKTFSAILKDMWSKYGILFILVGIGLLIAKFGNIATSLLAAASKKDVENAQKTDAQLKSQEDAANQQADALVKKADELPAQQGTVTDDWYKKQNE